MELTSKASPQNMEEMSERYCPQRPPLSLEMYQDRECLDKLTYLIVRPPRVKYNPRIIKNPMPQTYNMNTYQIPFDLTVFTPHRQAKYCILYLHGNSSCRLEGMNMVKQIPTDAALACFDFEGCGNGKQEWITLGIKQSKQANVAAKFLEQKGFTVVGWGRSMGAASLLLSNIKIMIVDSAFCSLKELCSTVAHNQVKWLPNCLFCCLFSCVFCLVKSDFKSKTSEQIQQLTILTHISNDKNGSQKYAMFISGDQDTAIDCSHSKRLHQSFKGQKQLLIFKGTHNSTRPRTVLTKCFHFIQNSLSITKISQQQNSSMQLKQTQKNQDNLNLPTVQQFPVYQSNL